MGQDMMIEMLKSKLEAANATNIHLNATIKSREANFNATVSDLRKTNANLEKHLRERDAGLEKSKNVMRGLEGAFFPKKSEQQKVRPKTGAEIEEMEQHRENQRKARKNNGAKRNMHFEMETVT